MKLESYFKQSGKTLEACSIELNVNLAAFHKWVKGRTIPSINNMQKIVIWSNGAVQPNDFYLTTVADEA